MEHHSLEPPALEALTDSPDHLDCELDSPAEPPLIDSQPHRHDGWTGQRMAMFCALLAESGIVTDACIAVGMSTTSAYSARRRNALFAAAWEDSLKLARDRLADALLERSLNGCVEKYYRDGELVGEKRIVDNRLAMQVLRRLDQRAAELGLASPPLRTELKRAACPGDRRALEGRGALAPTPDKAPDWDLMLSALRTGDEDMIAEALAEASRAGLTGVGEVGEVGEVCVAADSGAVADEEEQPERCWRDDDHCWWTDFPPPPGFRGDQEGHWGDYEYKRECTREEGDILEAALIAETADDRAADAALRDSWFAALKLPRTSGDDVPEPADCD